jgi:3-carboxy-cis,cis-muconate cycloisomerase
VDAPSLDTGLLSPVRAGTPAEALVDDAAWLQAMLDAEAGLARAQAGLGTVPRPAADRIAAVAVVDRFDLVGLARRAREAANPVVALVRDLAAAVAAEDPDAARYVHQGSTSQDVLDTAAMLVSARVLRELLVDLDRVAAALAATADAHRRTPMAGRTLTQHAVPTTFGLKAAGWLVGVLDARDRVRRVLAGLPVQLGGAAGTLAGYLAFAGTAGRDRDYASALLAAYARELGLAEPTLPWHTVRTPVADLGGVLALVAGVLGKIAVDVQTLSRTELAELAEPSAPGRGASSAMPQKANPVLSTLVRSAALQVPALASVLAQCLVAEDERPAGAWHAEWEPLRQCLRLTGGAARTAAELVEGLQVHPGRMRELLDSTGGLIVAERVAAVLTLELGKTAAKDVVARVAGLARADGRPFGELLLAAPELAGRFDLAELAALLDPTGYLGAADTLVDRALARFERSRQPV